MNRFIRVKKLTNLGEFITSILNIYRVENLCEVAGKYREEILRDFLLEKNLGNFLSEIKTVAYNQDGSRALLLDTIDEIWLKIKEVQ